MLQHESASNDAIAVTPASCDLYYPPRTQPLLALLELARTAWRGEGDLLSLLPAQAYTMRIGTRRVQRAGDVEALRQASEREERSDRHAAQSCASAAAISGISVCSALTGRTMTLKRVMRPASFHSIMSMPSTSISPSMHLNSSTAELSPSHSST